ncbi:hypothetical protein AAZX31_11G039600 [Glycine max]|uniref:Ras-related protein RABH1b isoform A n=1 Tax=Glycine soja TaxID=3848 RepID=A0A445HWU5_GLYSO|nr:hypothetical protein GLYMA_11G040451v4 [Glycine max]KAH1157513.1 hypothetical protein GYH30_029970 [Glycine max]RZB78241.1 Ras-related protein RABH1b isoform A [Glycine soja]RZB78242.1 Ras-related protein RABH1b isoform B [Glycine soja]RZB78243.1 Ras-related protein RABH1b isoform C [Glycine soja]
MLKIELFGCSCGTQLDRKDLEVLFQATLGTHLLLYVIAYDVASRQTFLNTSRWIEEVRIERGSDAIIVHVGNKTDLVNKRQVSTEEGEAKSRELNVMFIEASAKAGFNIKALFRKIAAALPGMETLSSTKQEDMVDVDLRSFGGYQSQPQSGGCAC